MATEVKDYSVNMGDINIINMKVVETAPPNSPFAKLMGMPGTQTTPSLGRGNLNNSAIALLNGNLEHACDFKFMINVDVFALFGVVNPVEAIQKALRNAKLKATNRLRTLLKDAIKYIREGLDLVLDALGFDPSGQLALSFQIGKELVDKINTAIQWVAEKVEEVMEWVYFAQQIQQLINWIKSLPEKLKKMLATCLANFTNSIKQVADQLKSIPDQIINATQSQIEGLANQFTQAAQEVANAAQGALDDHSSSMPDALYQALIDPSSDNAAAVTAHIESTTPSKDEVNKTSNEHEAGANSKGI
jgi:ElaB/YqjD/DUF883 family membrane-anchored ribosome-binding protein